MAFAQGRNDIGAICLQFFAVRLNESVGVPWSGFFLMRITSFLISVGLSLVWNSPFLSVRHQFVGPKRLSRLDTVASKIRCVEPLETSKIAYMSRFMSAHTTR